MSEGAMLGIALSLIAALFAMLTLILGWLGNKIYEKLCEMARLIHQVEGVAHDRITAIDKRLVAVEARCSEHRGDCQQ